MFILFDFLQSLPRRLFRLFLLLYLLVAVPVRALYWWIRLMGKPLPTADPTSLRFDVICLSHVPWSHIWQRNHHTMTRLARDSKVIYLQTTSIAYIHWFVKQWPHSRTEYSNTFPGLTLAYPLLLPGESRIPFVRSMNRWILSTQMRWLTWRHNLRNPVLWFYYPACSYVLDSYQPAAVVYDIQDEYTAFDWSPRDIAERERELIARADIIFAGTHALYERKTAGFRGRAFFYPCAVEFSHFYSAAPEFDESFFRSNPDIPAQSADIIRRIAGEFRQSGVGFGTVSIPAGETESRGSDKRASVSPQLLAGCAARGALHEPVEIQKLRRPRLLYVGLIDKRIDPDLLARLGQSHPEWEIVMVGPVDNRIFNQQSVEAAAPNVHFVGPVLYRWLPNFLAYCDVYLMPWKVNDLTRHINPTKTLEYMAAGRPVVSISLPDLENLFSDSVSLANTPEEFIAQCEAALEGKRWDKVATGLERAWGFAWETVVEEMRGHVRDAIKARGPRN